MKVTINFFFGKVCDKKLYFLPLADIADHADKNRLKIRKDKLDYKSMFLSLRSGLLLTTELTEFTET